MAMSKTSDIVKIEALIKCLNHYDQACARMIDNGEDDDKRYRFIPSCVRAFLPKVAAARAIWMAYKQLEGKPLTITKHYTSHTYDEKHWTDEARRKKRGYDRIRFLDIGCGLGSKVLLASSLDGIQSFGLEVNEEYVKFAKNLVDGGDKKIITGNCITFKKYQDFEILHFYTPLSNQTLEVKFENRLYKQIVPGSVVIANGSALGHLRKPLPNDIHEIYGQIHIKIDDHFPANKVPELKEIARKEIDKWSMRY